MKPLVFLLALVTSLPVASAAVFVTGLESGGNSTPPIPGVQDWSGQLGDDFTTGNNPLQISRVGVFDSNSNGLSAGTTLVWRIYEVISGNQVGSDFFFSGPTGGSGLPGIEGNYLWQSASITLAANTAYSVVAFGFNSNDLNFNTTLNPKPNGVDFTTFGLVAGNGRYSDQGDVVGIPTIGGAFNFGAATFDFTATPEPTTLLIWGGLACIGGIVALRNKRQSA